MAVRPSGGNLTPKLEGTEMLMDVMFSKLAFGENRSVRVSGSEMTNQIIESHEKDVLVL